VTFSLESKEYLPLLNYGNGNGGCQLPLPNRVPAKQRQGERRSYSTVFEECANWDSAVCAL